MTSLVEHMHAFVREVDLTEDEWRRAIEVLTATGHITDSQRQEWVLWSDTLGISTLVDAICHAAPAGATESTVVGPFYVADSPWRDYGARLDEVQAGQAAFIHGFVRSLDGAPIGGAELDVWQNGENELYAVQDSTAPEGHLRGRFRTRDDGSYAFVAVRPTAYPIPHDGPVGRMLAATKRHPWRPAHIHVIVRATGHRSVTTHIFDAASEYIDSDAVFAVKGSLLREFVPRAAADPERPLGIEGDWYSLRNEFVLVPSEEPAEAVNAGRTA
jgi:hydroxyquinol 1,2-dioxygenase